MIKPHGSDKLNPLYVADDAKRTALLKELCQSDFLTLAHQFMAI